jgi:hypothetical protein
MAMEQSNTRMPVRIPIDLFEEGEEPALMLRIGFGFFVVLMHHPAAIHV